MQLNHAAESFILSKQVGGLSPYTIRNYKRHLRRLQAFIGPETPVSEIGRSDIQRFILKLKTKPPEGQAKIPKSTKPLSPKSIKNVHSCLSSFWTWLQAEGLVEENVVQRVEAPKPKPPEIKPFSKKDLQALLYTARRGWTKTHSLRDVAIILFLLDTGVRASELVRLNAQDVNLVEGKALVTGKGRLDYGKGKERYVIFSNRTGKALHRYWLHIGKPKGKEPAFQSAEGRRLNRKHLYKHITRLGKKADVPDCYPHRFRHTFAIQFLRNQGNVYMLQRLLGHSSLDMSKRYLKIVQTDIDKAGLQSSPVKGWGL